MMNGDKYSQLQRSLLSQDRYLVCVQSKCEANLRKREINTDNYSVLLSEDQCLVGL